MKNPIQTVDVPRPEVTRDHEALTFPPTLVQQAVAMGGQSLGEYQLVKEIARGGMGAVYLARQENLGRFVALKVILNERIACAKALGRFQQEARAAAALDHPHIVPLFEIGENEGRHYFTMAYIDGPTLQKWVIDHGLPAPNDAALLVATLAETVAYAHERGIIHRDLKPANVLMQRANATATALDQHTPRIADFGLAKQNDTPADLTGTGDILGTPSYMAPEQVQGDPKTIGAAADIYALGGILYHLLTGKTPFATDNRVNLMIQVLQVEPTPPRQHNANVPPILEAIVLRCLSKKPEARFESATALARALRAWKEAPTRVTDPAPGRPSAAVSTPVVMDAAPTPAGHFAVSSRWRKAFLIAGTAAILGAAMVVLALVFWPEQTETYDLPRPEYNDFGLQVEVIGSQASNKGVENFRAGQPMSFKVTAEQDIELFIWYVGEQETTLLFPNPDERNNELRANTLRLIPDPSKDYVFKAKATPGREYFHIVATNVLKLRRDKENLKNPKNLKSVEDQEVPPLNAFLSIIAMDKSKSRSIEIERKPDTKPKEPLPLASEQITGIRVNP